MPTPLVVPDASVLLRWVLPSENEPEVDQALLLRRAIVADVVRAIVPPLWLYEVGNTIARCFPAQACAWLTAMMKFGLEEAAPSASWPAAVLELTRAHRVTFYDAADHALAISRKGVFVTTDVRYADQMAGEGSVVALCDWKPPATSRGSRR